MKTVLTLFILCGAILSVESACSTNDAATCTSSLTATCDGYKTYANCLKEITNDCTASATDVAVKAAIDSTVATAETYINQNCGDSCSIASCVISDANCDAYKTYVSCLKDGIKDCTDATIKFGVETTIDAAEISLSQHCGGCMVTMSLTTLILSLLGVYLKI